MKVLLINGSPHAKGSTYTALHEMEKVFTENGIEAEIVHIGNKDIRGCVACGACMNICPRQAIQVKNGKKAIVAPSSCVGCGLCEKTCPAGIIEIREREMLHA